MSRHKSDSSEQQTTEKDILKALEDELDVLFDSEATLPSSLNIKPDAINLKSKVIVEVYARIGAVNGGQKHKIQGDILKLALAGKNLDSGWRKIMCFASGEAAKYVKGKSWVAEAAKEFGVEIHIISLTGEQEDKIRLAQKRQQMVNQKI